MRARVALLALITLTAPVAGCSPAADDPSAIGAEDDRALNDAAAMLDANSVEAHTPPSTESSPHD